MKLWSGGKLEEDSHGLVVCLFVCFLHPATRRRSSSFQGMHPAAEESSSLNGAAIYDPVFSRA
jgi:hypothetical protein